MATSKAKQKPAPARSDTVPTQIGLTMSVELGRAKITLDDALTYTEQSVIELDKLVGEPVNILVNGTLFARGEVMTVDEKFGVQVVEVLDPDSKEADNA
ncbi:MAG: flagellar motor switch protein FliN [Gemmatimonadetes bacterium]|jgi:flagellar motor switch protein FliN|nr:flagellar motor switch protein FliN [Gemmatimonadota bacterium]MBT4612351.1 flagellar motor switch protein FliN [Gemmatimonadota bacterium]MBT5057267.1 flagellar motor switch protein FliN [Gemmatimonadota bacterium]MBT5145735.1 flagellar motor switch protein FliN [Gemmatimonadota bacterium]MBT5588035.1 flagellar motor switch protein FliN [Gemmatimonadota bacterium]